MGRVYSKPVGLVQASAALRYAFLGVDHYDYDMICSFHSLVASLLSREEAPILHWVVDQLQQEGGRGKDAENGGFECWNPKRCVLSVYNNSEPQLHDSASMLWATNRGRSRAPRWFIDFTPEVWARRARLREVCSERGFLSPHVQLGARSETFYHVSNVESRLIRGMLRRIRERRGIFSHYMVHDGVYIDSSIEESIIKDTFNLEATTLRLDRVRIARKPWDDAKTEYHRLLSGHGYSYDANIPIPPLDRTSQAEPVHTPLIVPVTTDHQRPEESRGVLPKNR